MIIFTSFKKVYQTAGGGDQQMAASVQVSTRITYQCAVFRLGATHRICSPMLAPPYTTAGTTLLRYANLRASS